MKPKYAYVPLNPSDWLDRREVFCPDGNGLMVERITDHIKQQESHYQYFRRIDLNKYKRVK